MSNPDDTANTPSPDPSDPQSAADARIAEIRTLFSDVRSLLQQTLQREGPITKTTTQKMLAKLGELQTAHLMVLRAEEDFHDKFSQDAAAEHIDYAAARRDIGRALDRIRAALGPDDFSGRADG